MRVIGFLFILSLISSALAYSYVSVHETREMAENGAFVIDVRYGEEYEKGHIAGSILLPLGELEKTIRSGALPFTRNDSLILYCDCPAEETSIMAASILEHYGFSRVAVMKGGWQAWEDAGFPVATGGESGSLSKRKEECKSCETQPPQTLSSSLPQTREPEKSSVPILFFFFLLACIGIVGMMLVYAYFKKR